MSERVIHKYRLSANVFFLPETHRVIHFGIQDQEIHLWAEVDTESRKQPYAALVVPTGAEPPNGAKHAWTWFDGPSVWHLYVDRKLQLRGEEP